MTEFKATHTLVFKKTKVVMGLKRDGSKGYVRVPTEIVKEPVMFLSGAGSGFGAVRVLTTSGKIETVSRKRLEDLE